MNSRSSCTTPDPCKSAPHHKTSLWFTTEEIQKVFQNAVQLLASSPFFMSKATNISTSEIQQYAQALMDFDLERSSSKEQLLSFVEAYSQFDSDAYTRRKESIRKYIHTMCTNLYKQLKLREGNISVIITTFQQKHSAKGISAEKKLVYEKLLHRWRTAMSLILKKQHDWTHDDCENARKTIADVDSCMQTAKPRQRSPPAAFQRTFPHPSTTSMHSRAGAPTVNTTPTFRTPQAPPHRNSGALRPHITPNQSKHSSPPAHQFSPPQQQNGSSRQPMEICCVCARELSIENGKDFSPQKDEQKEGSPSTRPRISTPLPESEEMEMASRVSSKRKRVMIEEGETESIGTPSSETGSPLKRVKMTPSPDNKSTESPQSSLSEKLFLKFREAILNRDKSTIQRLTPNFWHSLHASDKSALLQLSHEMISKDTDIMGQLLSS